MNVSVLQMDIFWESPEENLRTVFRYADRLPSGTDLLVVPEMFSTGFTLCPETVAEPMNGRTVTELRNWSARTGTAFGGSLCVRETSEKGKIYFNRFILIRPDGSLDWYDKKHLFGMGGEREKYTAGTERKIMEYKGVRFLPLVCYDIRFPVWARNRADYDVLIFSANWPEPRTDVWRILLRARAIENQCYVIGANRVGTEPSGLIYSGASAVIDPKGRAPAEANDREQLLSVRIDLEEQRRFREKFPAWRDTDPFEL